MADTKIITVRQAGTPQEVTDALASLTDACNAWPTVQKEVPVSGAPVFQTEPPSSNDQIIMCDLVVNPTEVITDGMKHTAILSAIATLLVVFLLFLAWKAVKGVWDFGRGFWSSYKSTRMHG